jgi:uncharacterized protein (TIGR03435 family)
MVLAGLLAAAVLAQAQAAFEVAAVKRNTLEDRIVTIRVGPGGRFDARGYTLVLLIQRAYGVMDWNVSGGPGWIRTDRWDVAAKANVAGDLTEAQLQPRLQRLLAERFKLKLHRSSKEMPGYALEIAKGGPKLQPSAEHDPRPDTFRMTATGMSGQGIPMEDLARFVAGKLGLIGADETGLKGLYDLRVEWKVDPSLGPDSGEDYREAWRVAVVSALQEQLGLKLTAKKITVPTLVIDGVERASAAEN